MRLTPQEKDHIAWVKKFSFKFLLIWSPTLLLVAFVHSKVGGLPALFLAMTSGFSSLWIFLTLEREKLAETDTDYVQWQSYKEHLHYSVDIFFMMNRNKTEKEVLEFEREMRRKTERFFEQKKMERCTEIQVEHAVLQKKAEESDNLINLESLMKK
jgi:hypothetical protein